MPLHVTSYHCSLGQDVHQKICLYITSKKLGLRTKGLKDTQNIQNVGFKIDIFLG